MRWYQYNYEQVYAKSLEQADKAKALRIHAENAKFDDDLFSFWEDELPEEEVYALASFNEMRSEAIGQVWQSYRESLEFLRKNIDEEIRFHELHCEEDEIGSYKNIGQILNEQYAIAEEKIKESVTSFINYF